MIVFAVVLLIVAAVLLVFGLVIYGNGVGTVPDDVGHEPAATRQGVARISWKDLFGRMRTSVRGMTTEGVSREEKLTATGAFCVMVGLVAVIVAVLAIIVVLV